MTAGSRIPAWIVGLLALLCCLLLAWTTFGFVVPFEHESGQAVLDTYLAGYDRPVAERMQGLLGQNETARHLLRSMYLGPELVLPALLTMLLFSLALKLQPAPHREVRLSPNGVTIAACLFACVYGIADYAENIGGLVMLGKGPYASLAVAILPWATRVKFLALAICAILLLRSFIFGKVLDIS